MNIRKLEAIVALNKLSKDRYRKLQNQNFKIKTSKSKLQNQNFKIKTSKSKLQH